MLEAFLDQLSISNLKEIARNYGLTNLRDDDVARAIRTKLLDTSYLRGLYGQLSEFERFVLHEFIFSIGTELFTSRQLEQWQGKISNSEFRIGLTKLRQKGFIYTLRRMWGEIAYVFPEDVFRLWSGVVLAFQKHEEVIEPLRFNASITHSRLPGIDQDLFHLLASIAKMELPVTQKGMIYKRYVTKIAEGFVDRSHHMLQVEGPEEPALIDPKRYDPDIYSNRFAFLVTLGEKLGLLRTAEGLIRIDVKDTERWLKLSSDKMMAVIYDTWKQLRPAFIHQWLYFVQTMMEEENDRNWHSVDGLIKPLNEMIGPDPDGKRHKSVLEALIRPLHYLGFIEVGTDPTAGDVWRWLALDITEEQRRFYIQPNFEVLLPPHFSMAARWTLSQMATLLRSDQMIVYQLSEESYTGAIELGYNSEELIRYLSTHCVVPLPSNVEMSLRQWGQSYGQVKFLDVMVMECAESRLVDELMQQPKLSKSVIQRISPTHLLIYREELPELRTWLERHGYSPLKRVITMDKNDSLLSCEMLESVEASSAEAFHFIVKTGTSDEDRHWTGLNPIEVHGYRVENIYPEIEEAVPGLKQIPKMWLDQYRTYHKSTLRDLLLKAIDLKLRLKLKVKDEEYSDLLPTVMRNVGGTWVLETERDSEVMQVNIDNIEKVQLTKPTIDI